ncbi:hypothetical protein MLGJGCBP_08056 [Rhodococcus sp. T7]|nr:hypothetical protein MLGJGCBP_08967 [Rhodococcus sp. T7]KAF0958862.1 hypothetical protein MLGJGCBP_08056 [Rhodococcus sp. T7]
MKAHGATVTQIAEVLGALVRGSAGHAVHGRWLKMVEHTTSSIHHNLGLLQAFADENGHANVHNKYAVEGVNLGRGA